MRDIEVSCRRAGDPLPHVKVIDLVGGDNPQISQFIISRRGTISAAGRNRRLRAPANSMRCLAHLICPS
jgi:hypothetical protein